MVITASSDQPDGGPTEAQQRWLYRFRQALRADLEEIMIAFQVQAVHDDLVRDTEAYKELWRFLDSRERSAIKAYMAMATATRPAMKANGRA